MKPRRRRAPLKVESRPAGRGANLCHWNAVVRSTCGVIGTAFFTPGSAASLVGAGWGDSAWCEQSLPRGLRGNQSTDVELENGSGDMWEYVGDG